MSVCKSCQAACGHHLGRTLDTLRGQSWYRQVGREARSGNNKMRICFPNILHNRILDTEMVKNGEDGAWMLKSAWWKIWVICQGYIRCPKDLLHPRPSLCSNLPAWYTARHYTKDHQSMLRWIFTFGVLVKLVMPQNVGTAMWLMPVVYWKDAHKLHNHSLCLEGCSSRIAWPSFQV